MSSQYTHFDILTCQMWLHVLDCLLILLRFLGFFIHNWRAFMSEIFHFLNFLWFIKETPNHKKFSYVGMSTCQMWLQVMEGSLIKLHFWEFSYMYDITSCLKRYNFIKLLQIVCYIIIYGYVSYLKNLSISPQNLW